MNNLFSSEHWDTYKPILIQNIHKIPKDVFKNKTFGNISFVGVPLEEIEFRNCSFIEVDFRGIDLSQTTFTQCKFTNTKIDGVKIKGDYIFKDTICNIDLISLYSGYITTGDLFKSENDSAITKYYYEVAQVLNDFIFKAVKINLENFDLRNLNLRWLQLEKAQLTNIIFPPLKMCSLITVFFNILI